MKSRRKAREAALMALYRAEVGKTNLRESMADVLENGSLSEDLAAYAEQIVKGIGQNSQTIDGALEGLTPGYDFMRIVAVDRNIMRIAAYELMFEPDLPPAVTLNEAVELAKRYSTAESGKFVNGVLGRLLAQTPKANWVQPEQPLQEEGPDDSEEPLEASEPEVLAGDDPRLEELSRVGNWKIRKEDQAS